MTTVYKEMRLRPDRKTDGDIGLEIEVEGNRLPRAIAGWRFEHDGSLRGADSAEYVLANPMSLEGVSKCLAKLEEAYVLGKSKVDDSVRAGVHVHINCQKLSLVQLVNFMTLYMVMENVLVRFCGEGREGNLFCLRVSDAEYLQNYITNAIQNRHLRDFHSDNIRYSSMNLKALGDYGSLEFRAMRSTRDLSRIYSWVEVLYNLREIAKEYVSPTEIIGNFSADGPIRFLQNHLGEHFGLITKGINQKELVAMLFEGMRNAQDIAYCINNWEAWDQPKKKLVGGLQFDEDDDANEPEEDF